MSFTLLKSIALGAALIVSTSFCTNLVAEEPIKIGLLTPKTGPLAGPGKQMEDGIRFFLKERNNTLVGKNIELIVADTAEQPALARTKAQELVERYGVQVLIGPLATTEMLAIDDYIRDDAKIPLISPSALAEDVTQRKPNPWLLRAVASTGQLVHPLGDYAGGTLGYKRIATVATDFAYGHEAVAGFQRVFEDNGGRVVQKIWVPITTSDFAAYIAQIKQDVDAVFVSFSGASATTFVRQYREYGLKGKLPFLSTESTVDESLLNQEGDDAIGIISGAIYSAAINTPENKAFVTTFRKEYGVEPGFYSAGAYVGGMFLEEALKEVKGDIEDKQALMRALRSAKLARSPRGALRVDEYGNPIANAYICKTERSDGRMQNTVIEVYPNQGQFWTYKPEEYLANPVYSRDYPPAKYIEK
jgi:branched-chain amino acid transport system substrate-binding protein